jgi:uncharacterized protein
LSTLSDRVRDVLAPGSARAGSVKTIEPPADPESFELSALGGVWTKGCFVVDRLLNAGAAYGRETIGGVAASLDRSAGAASLFAAAAGAPFVFVDLETTGLSGGAGTHVFLFGCGWFTSDAGFATRQLLLTRFEDEPDLLQTAAAEIGRAGAVVSFNGKSFDAPVLETRFQFHRLEWDRARIPHIDVLHPARRFWPGSNPGITPAGHTAGQRGDCSLVALEQRVGWISRSDDVPGFEVPGRYFRFLRTGDARLLAPVLEHNRCDLLTVAALLARLLHLSEMGARAAGSAAEALALGRLYIRAGFDDRAREAFMRCIEMSRASEGAYDPVRVDAMCALAQALRRSRCFDEAARWWQRLVDTRGCPQPVLREAIEALAIHHEHRVRDLATAKTLALRNLEGKPHPRRVHAVEHRVARLDRKLERRNQELGLFALLDAC